MTISGISKLLAECASSPAHRIERRYPDVRCDYNAVAAILDCVMLELVTVSYRHPDATITIKITPHGLKKHQEGKKLQ